MITSTPKFLIFTPVFLTLAMLSGCNQNEQKQTDKVEIKAAPTLTNDATTYAHKAWDLINQIDPIVYTKKVDQIDEQVRKPLRQLSTDWRINVKMTDSVTEGKYALCRKALTSLDTWARETKDNSTTVTQKQADYERDKSQCKDAIANPALGNTDPKR
ncbi:hypothetical protein F942_01985 [Acinetobacter ursingii ANC 3649]|uniref:Uncharacterized protein n=3 Tax=Moraxellaceae TaxID=468 RepID=N9DFD7_9GAMM|nr:hypothetical protein F942_01985 [Acinetobacter ursingii ANC 3649]QXZ23438.1 hypothetical protein I6L31_01105 [Acinetobacter septicus]